MGDVLERHITEGLGPLPALMRNIPRRKILVNVAPISGEILIKLDLEKNPQFKNSVDEQWVILLQKT